MKLAFSTVGCPDYNWTEIYSMAKDLGFQGIEMRVTGGEYFSLHARPFKAENIESTLSDLKKRHLEIPCLSSNCSLKYKEKTEENITKLMEYIELAYKLGTPYIRILADEHAKEEGEVDDNHVIEVLKKLMPFAEVKNVTLLVETNGVYADTSRLKNLLDSVPSDNIGALWDIHHPYRFKNEQPEETIRNLGAYVKYVHVKDSVMDGDKVSYRLMGEGDIPFGKAWKSLESINYEGYISFEWVRNYAPDLENAGVVFPHFIHYMSQYISQAELTGRLYDNARKTGKYVWPKEHLIDLTFPQVLDRMAEEFPDQQAFKYYELDYDRTYSQFRDDVDTFACSLIALGVKPGDHVAIWATNIPQWYITFWATTKIGAVLVTVNTAYKIHEAEFLLRQSDTHTLVMIDGYKDSNYSEIIGELCPELKTANKYRPLFMKRLPFLRNIITCGFEKEGCYTWEEAIELSNHVPIEEVYRRASAVDKDDVCNMQYTSGTTGFPKGVMLTHYNVVNNGKAIGDCMDLSTADRLMIQVPMFHCFGMVLAMTASMTHGTTMCPITAFSPRKGLACITQEKITAFHGVPTMFIAMLGHPDFEKTDFSHMRTGIMAGSPCPIKVMEDVINKMHMDEICITYGQTEASPA